MEERKSFESLSSIFSTFDEKYNAFFASQNSLATRCESYFRQSQEKAQRYGLGSVNVEKQGDTQLSVSVKESSLSPVSYKVDASKISQQGNSGAVNIKYYGDTCSQDPFSGEVCLSLNIKDAPQGGQGFVVKAREEVSTFDSSTRDENNSIQVYNDKGFVEGVRLTQTFKNGFLSNPMPISYEYQNEQGQICALSKAYEIKHCPFEPEDTSNFIGYFEKNGYQFPAEYTVDGQPATDDQIADIVSHAEQSVLLHPELQQAQDVAPAQ